MKPKQLAPVMRQCPYCNGAGELDLLDELDRIEQRVRVLDIYFKQLDHERRFLNAARFNIGSPKPRPEGEAPLLDELSAAHFLQISVRTLQGWRVAGKGPRFYKIGRKVRYKPRELERWVQTTIRGETNGP